LFPESTRFVKFGIAVASEGWMLAIRFLARSSVVILGDKGKFPSV
jgi:hypothetical protein